MHIFTDSSVKNNIAIGCYLIIEDLDDPIDIKTISMISSSSTIAEMTTIHHVLVIVDMMPNKLSHITLYTDCENFVNLIERRQYDEKLKNHRNYEFYKTLIDLVKNNNVDVKWIKGHSKKADKDKYEMIFSLVDKQARKLVRQIG
uniref:RNase H type-1 domain-containing protein n=1 Tax=viral metagenome TaxID=1070528 RepID=A0A6C0CA52_9ZZZZ